MARLPAHATEIVGRIDDSAAKVIMPNAVNDRSPGQRIFWVSDPPGESGATSSFILRLRKLEARTQSRNRRQSAGADCFTRFVNVPAFQNMDRARRPGRFEVSFRNKVVRRSVNHLRRRQ